MRTLIGFLGVAVAFTVVDLLWLGVFAADFYDGNLGALKAQPVVKSAAAIFYVFYLLFIYIVAVRGAEDARNALARGAGMGLFAYGTYEFTNWAVIQGWPAIIVPVDIIWGVILTGSTAYFGRVAHDWAGRFESSAD